MSTKRRELTKPTFEAKYIVHFDSGTVLQGDWGSVSEQEFEEMCHVLEQIRTLAHFSIVQGETDVFVNPSKIEYVEVHTRDLES